MDNLMRALKVIGLNESQRKTYLYILKNKQINLKSVAELNYMSSAGATKLLNDMVEKGFVKKFKVGSKKVYMATDMNTLQQEIRNNKKEELNLIEQAFSDLRSGYGDYSIKVIRPNFDDMVGSFKSSIKNVPEVYELIDFSNILKKTSIEEYDNKKFKTLYFGEEGVAPHGIRLSKTNSGNYAQVLVYGDRVDFTTTNKEIVVIENEEIVKSISYLIDYIYNNKKQDTL